MPRYGKRKTYRRKKRGKVYKKGIPRKALTGKADTKLEKMVVRLAKKEARALLVPLIYRQFFGWGTGDENGPVSFDFSQKGLPVPLEGGKWEMQTIPLRMTTAQGSSQSANGYRATDTVKIYGVTVGIRCEFQNFDQAANPGLESNALHWAVVGCRTKLNAYLRASDIPAPANQNAAVTPLNQRIVVLQDHRIRTQELLPLTPWGYSERLDNVEVPLGATAQPLAKNPYSAQGKYAWKKTFHRGIVRSRLIREDHAPNVKRFSKFIRFKKPLTMHYVTSDGTGSTILGPMKLFLCMRSEIPLNPMSGIDNEYLPKACGFYKVHYYDS